MLSGTISNNFYTVSDVVRNEKQIYAMLVQHQAQHVGHCIWGLILQTEGP